MSETRRCCFWNVRCSRQTWRERAYSTITSVFGVPSFTSEPKISINGWNRGERKPTQQCKHYFLLTFHALNRFVHENKFLRSSTPSKFFEKQFFFVKS